MLCTHLSDHSCVEYYLMIELVTDTPDISVIVHINQLFSRRASSRLSKSSIRSRPSPLPTVVAKVHVRH